MGKMRIVSAMLLSIAAGSAMAQIYVQPHVDKNGTYREGHHRSRPDSNPYNNYSTQGNTNPYTGQAGTVNPYSAPNYGNSRGSSGTQQQPYSPYQQRRGY